MPDSLDGNDSQNRRIANQLFDVWEERRGSKWLNGSAPAWIACALSLAAVLWNAAIISGNVAENTRRIDAVETEQQRAAGDSRQVIERMARIEAKLDIVLEDRK
jgi:hypothetical protein